MNCLVYFALLLFVLVNQVTKNTQRYGFSHSKTINALGLRPRAFISEFFVFRNPDETLALVFEIALKMLVSTSPLLHNSTKFAACLAVNFNF